MPSKVRLFLGGDMMLGRGVNEMILRMGPAYPVQELAPVTRKADLFFVNLECAITDKDLVYRGPPKAFYFRASRKAIETLQLAGVHLVNLANNHALDADYEGLLDTLQHLDRAGIAHVGAGENIEAARKPALLQKKGLRIGVLGCCDHQEDFAATEDRSGIYHVDPDNSEHMEGLITDIRALREHVDVLVLSYHWMPNWVPHIPEQYRQTATRLLQAGVDVLWGHSPHHFLGVAWLKHKVILYSTGDLIDDYAIHPVYRNDRQLLFACYLTPEGVADVEALPLQLEYACTLPASGPVRRWILERFARYCKEVGSRIEVHNDWIRVIPEQEDGA